MSRAQVHGSPLSTVHLVMCMASTKLLTKSLRCCMCVIERLNRAQARPWLFRINTDDDLVYI